MSNPNEPVEPDTPTEPGHPVQPIGPAHPPQQAEPEPAPPVYGEPAPQQPYPPQPQGNPYAASAAAKRGIRAWVWWVIGGAAALVILVVVGAVVLFNVLLGGSGARSVAEQYVNAIATGDASAANALARVDSSDENYGLLADAVLDEAELISSPKLTSVQKSPSSDLTQVAVAYKLAGKSYRGTFELEKDEKGWYVSRGLTYQLPYVSSALPGFRVAGADALITSKSADVTAYPGVYDIQAPNKYYELAGDPKLTVAPDAYELEQLDLTPSAAYVAEVQKQLDAHYAQCATKTDYYEVEDCGIDLSRPSELATSQSTVAVTVEESPKVTVGETGSLYKFEIGGGKFSAVMSGTTYLGAAGTENLTGQAGYLSADISITADGVVKVTFY
ncbi:MAG: hypothetical protein ACTHMF_05130 [Leifsonia sp.]|uniref:hypothetical protein n=1 Tax=Leifsonia sp. TaxID=1870902 RepID=UPI003F7D0E47